jgi:hypothetical protein
LECLWLQSSATEGGGSPQERAVRLEEIMMPYLAESHRILLEHLL